MFNHTTYDLDQVADKLQVELRVLALVNAGMMPATRVGKNILIADQDLFIFLRRSSRGTVPKQDQSIVGPIKTYLAKQLVLGWLTDDPRKTNAQDRAVLEQKARRLIERLLARLRGFGGRETVN